MYDNVMQCIMLAQYSEADAAFNNTKRFYRVTSQFPGSDKLGFVTQVASGNIIPC